MPFDLESPEVRKLLASGFNAWMRRYESHPEEFEHRFNEIAQFRQEMREKYGTQPTPEKKDDK